MNIKSLSEKFWVEGFLHIEDFFDPFLMDEINALILDHFGMNPDWEHTNEFIEKSGAEIVPWFPQREGVEKFDRISQQSLLREITEAILGPGWGELYSMSMFSKRGTKGQAWHQDCPPENPDQFNLNRLVYTHDITDDIGGQVLVVPGTHKKGELITGGPFENIYGQVALSPKKGDLVFLHGHCWHRVMPVTGAFRVSTNYRAMPKGTPEEITDIAVYRNMRYKFSTSEIIEERAQT